MRQAIWAYTLTMDRQQDVELPLNSTILSVDVIGNDTFLLYAIIDTDEKRSVKRHIWCYGIGTKLPNLNATQRSVFLNTVIMSKTSYHFFEIVNMNKEEIQNHTRKVIGNTNYFIDGMGEYWQKRICNELNIEHDTSHYNIIAQEINKWMNEKLGENVYMELCEKYNPIAEKIMSMVHREYGVLPGDNQEIIKKITIILIKELEKKNPYFNVMIEYENRNS